ncbi:MAG: hypothetical protein RIB67_01880 [Miltoncostaeaceae bacterium]
MRAPVLIAATLIALAGCGGGEPEPPGGAAAPSGSGYFVGSGPDGLGAVVDFAARDGVLDDLRDAMRARPEGAPPVWVGAVALVNRGSASVAVPRFIADLPGGGAVPLADPRAPRIAIPAADDLVPPAPLLIPPQGAVTAYVALRGADPTAVRGLRMVVAPGSTVGLGARSR